jgi:aryl-alcohol dehydrogenase-like predicted oxidoreductase
MMKTDYIDIYQLHQIDYEKGWHVYAKTGKY